MNFTNEILGFLGCEDSDLLGGVAVPCRDISAFDQPVTLLGEVEISCSGILAISRKQLNGEMYCFKEIIGIFTCTKKMNVKLTELLYLALPD